MNDIGNKIKEARKSLKLSVKELSDKTKVRVYVIEAIESGDYTVMPDVYMKSFIKTLTNFLKINYEEPTVIPKVEKPKKRTFDDEKTQINSVIPQKITEPQKPSGDILQIFKKTTENTSSNFTEIFRKNKIDKDKRYLYLNRAVYIALSLAVLIAIYFGFTSLNKSSDRLDNSEIIKGSDTVSLEEKTNDLFSYFEKPDSLRLTAKAHDTIWIRVLCDGKSVNEALLKPGMEESWAAKEYFLVDLGNVGGAKIYRNDELLTQFGKTGSVVKNIKITQTEVLNIYAQKPDSLKSKYKPKEKEKPYTPPRMIEQSTIYVPNNNPVRKDTIPR